MSAERSHLAESSFLVMLALADRPRHGLGIADDIASETEGAVRMGPGTLYGTLQKLADAGFVREVREAPDPDDHDSRRRYFRLTPRGERVLAAEAARLRLLVATAVRKRILAGA